MYPSYGALGSYQRPASPVLIHESGIRGLRSGSPIFMVPYAQPPDVSSRPGTADVNTQQTYYELSRVQTPQVQNPYGRASSPTPPTSAEQAHTQWQPPVIQGYHHQRASDGGGEGYEVIDFYESLSNFPFYERCAYAMFYSREATTSHQQPVNILMILGSGGEITFPGGHIEETDQSVVDGLNRELREEINAKRKFQLNQSDYLTTFIRHKPPFIDHLYVREVSATELVELEKRVPGAPHWGTEVFGVLRVPLSVTEDGFRGFPAFLSNMFRRNVRTLLLEGIRQRQLMYRKQLKELIQASDRYLRNKLNAPDSSQRR